MIALALTLSLLAGPAGGAPGEPPTCFGEPATVVGTDGPDVLVGTSGRDVIWAGAGADEVRAREGDDLVCGGAGADRLHGGAGDDTLEDTVTGSRHQALLGGPGDNALHLAWRVVRGGEQVPVELLADLRQGLVRVDEDDHEFPLGRFGEVTGGFGSGVWTVVGTAAAETFTTHQYVAFTALAGGGDDVVRGSWHDDTVRGGAGRDTAYPDRGRDACGGVERYPEGTCEHPL